MWTLLFASVVLTFCGASAKIVNTINGPIDGNTVPLDDGTLINSWLGVPFGRAPVGDLRYMPPQTPDSWTEVLETKKLGPVCFQDAVGLLWMTHPGWSSFDEDCLNLNVFAPDDLGESPLAVMVWFYGGGYTGGANIQYPGHFLAAEGVIVVVPNYRIGALGFLATPDGSIRGNMGLQDQALALRWVRNNIANFGGNPNLVTIFGQSAGAGSSSLHMTSPYSQGLYHQAIMESGTESNMWTLNYPGQEPENYVYQTASNLNCPVDNIPDMVACLRDRNPRLIVAAQDLDCTPGYFCQGYAPIVDGVGGFVPRIPLDIRNDQSDASYVPIISGICRDDGSLYTAAYIPEANNGGFNSTEFNYYLQTRLIDMWAEQLTEEQYNNVYEALRYQYIDWPYLEDLDANREAFNKMVTDGAFGYPWDRQLKMNSERHPDTYAYVQSFVPLNATSFIPAWMGVPHMGEIPYVWGYGKLLTNPAVREDSEIFFDVVGWTPEDATLADFQIKLWTNFAKTGNPTPQPVKSPFDDTMITWDKFSWDDGLKVLDINWEVKIEENFRQQRNAFYYDYLSYITDRDFKSKKIENKPKKFKFNSRVVKDATNRMIREALAKRNVHMP